MAEFCEQTVTLKYSHVTLR